MSKRIVLIMISLLLLVGIFYSLDVLAQHPGGEPEEEEQTGTLTFSGDCAVGASWDNTVSEEFTGMTILRIVFELTWTDDEGADSEPDTFSLMTEDGRHQPRSEQGSGGAVFLFWDESGLNNAWNMSVTCDSAGPTTEPRGPLGILTQEVPDPGNSWTLTITYTYEGAGGGGPGGPPAYVLALYASPIFWSHVILMIISLYFFLITGFVGGALFIVADRWEKPDTFFKRWFGTPKMVLLLAGITFIAFFLASVPIGMWVAGKMYGWAKCWTGFPAFWNVEMYDITNADNTSLIGLVLWFIPLYFNRSQIYGSRLYDKILGRFKFAQRLREKAPAPRLSNKILGLCFFFIGVLIWLVYAVQPHGGGT